MANTHTSCSGAIGYPDCFPWFSSDSPGECGVNTLKLRHYRFLTNALLFIVIHLSNYRRYIGYLPKERRKTINKIPTAYFCRRVQMMNWEECDASGRAVGRPPQMFYNFTSHHQNYIHTYTEVQLLSRGKPTTRRTASWIVGVFRAETF
jgi:hypothetical protein